HQIEVENLPADASVSYSIEPDTEYDNNAREAGTYTITAVVTPPATAVNCEEITLTATLVIEKATLENISFEDDTFLRDCEEHALAITGDLPDGVSVTYNGNNQSEIGIFTVTANIDGGNNYNDLTLTVVMTIEDVLPQAAPYHSCGAFAVEEIEVNNLPTGWQAKWYATEDSSTPLETIEDSGTYYVV